MKVKIKDYGIDNDDEILPFVTYEISKLDQSSLDFLDKNLDEKTKIADDSLYITIFYDKDMFPFQSDEAKAKIADFIAREEIEMTVFLSSFLEDKE